MKIFGVLLSVLLIACTAVVAQTDFRPGYLVQLTGDTIYGEIDYRGDLFMGRICRFRDTVQSVSEYTAHDIQAYRFIDSKYFISKELNQNKVFMECLISGKLSIYYLRDEIGDHYYLEKEQSGLVEIPYEEGIHRVNGKDIYFESTKHIGILSLYMQDAPGFQSRIESLKKPGHQNLIRLAESYHDAVCKEERCLIYEKEVSFIRVLPEIIIGASEYTGYDAVDAGLYFHAGAIGHIWMPRSSENLYFRTGLIYYQLKFDGDKSHYLKIPCQLEYIYPKGIFRPRMAVGFDFYLPGFRSLAFDLGANIRLTERISFSVSSEAEFNPYLLLIPDELISYGMKLGVFLNL